MSKEKPPYTALERGLINRAEKAETELAEAKREIEWRDTYRRRLTDCEAQSSMLKAERDRLKAELALAGGGKP